MLKLSNNDKAIARFVATFYLMLLGGFLFIAALAWFIWLMQPFFQSIDAIGYGG